jgi:hypothetical protein
MTRVPTRRLRRALSRNPEPAALLASLGRADLGCCDLNRHTLLDRATHEAALLHHPYVGTEHVLLAALTLMRDDDGYAATRATILAAVDPTRPYGLGWFAAARRARGWRSAGRISGR